MLLLWQLIFFSFLVINLERLISISNVDTLINAWSKLSLHVHAGDHADYNGISERNEINACLEIYITKVLTSGLKIRYPYTDLNIHCGHFWFLLNPLFYHLFNSPTRFRQLREFLSLNCARNFKFLRPFQEANTKITMGGDFS